MPGDVHGGGGACMAGGMVDMHPPGRYYGYGIRSISGRYASYWNAFLFRFIWSNQLKIKDLDAVYIGQLVLYFNHCIKPCTYF